MHPGPRRPVRHAPALPKRLKILVNAGILQRERKGTWSCYRVADEYLAALEYLRRKDGPLRPSASRFLVPDEPKSLAS
ncbi:hypothetical protein [Saccharopolyspora hattusasensis]|uniref:hypothetical protein n=1 Tax=Saccharopolyspora hattusasensis TaxID=1128679 RepID=UPI003D99B22C